MGIFGEKEGQEASTGITPEMLQNILREAIKAAREPNAVEQRSLDQAQEADKRRLGMSLQLGKIEAEAQERKRNGCSHMRYAATAGRLSGHGAPKGALNTEFTTGGQALQNGNAALICTRCATAWIFTPSREQYAVIVQEGLMGMEPPRPEDCVQELEVLAA